MLRKLLLSLVGCVVLSGCGDMIKGKSVAEPQIDVFHERLNAKRFEDIYSATSDDFRKATPKEKLLQLLSAIERKLGPVQASSTTSWNVRTFNFTTTAVIVRNTTFERGVGNETFTFRVSGDKAFLVGYNINSLDMLTK